MMKYAVVFCAVLVAHAPLLCVFSAEQAGARHWLPRSLYGPSVVQFYRQVLAEP